MAIMKAWAVLFAFVGIQMAWNLKPFVGDRGEPFKVFRKHEGNFYTAIVYSIGRLVRGEPQPARQVSGHINVRGMMDATKPDSTILK